MKVFARAAREKIQAWVPEKLEILIKPCKMMCLALPEDRLFEPRKAADQAPEPPAGP